MTQSARAPWSQVIVVCRKCALRAGRKRFAKELKGAVKSEGGGKTTRVVEVGCLDLCPKRRLTVATGQDLSCGRLTVLPPTTVACDALHVLRDPAPCRKIDTPTSQP